MIKGISRSVLLLSFIVVLCLDACVLVPFINSYKEMGVTEGDRQVLLAKTLKKFQDYIYWGQYNNALSFASDGKAQDIKESFKKYREIKVVSIKTEDVVFLDSSNEAQVSTLVKYYKIPQYVVVDGYVNEAWECSMGNWKIKDRSVVSE